MKLFAVFILGLIAAAGVAVVVILYTDSLLLAAIAAGLVGLTLGIAAAKDGLL